LMSGASIDDVVTAIKTTQTQLDSINSQLDTLNSGSSSANPSKSGSGSSTWDKTGTVIDAIKSGVSGLSGLIGKDASVQSMDSGASIVPRDMLALVHRNETIIPRAFADAIRNGQMTLSGPSNGSTGGGGNTFITVEGSIISEKKLIEEIDKKKTKLKRRGYLVS